MPHSLNSLQQSNIIEENLGASLDAVVLSKSPASYAPFCDAQPSASCTMVSHEPLQLQVQKLRRVAREKTAK
jgi:hypothetical protein